MHESHQRDDAARVIDSVAETIAIGEKGQLPTQISHAKVVGTANWGRSREMLAHSMSPPSLKLDAGHA
jgi:N-acyl-D-aspartate/D-glutamate deacylase